jgi:excisionase family DNA binding protein
MKPVTLQLSVTLDEDLLTEIIRRAVINAIGIDPQREARIRASQHANFGGQKPPEDQGLLIDSREAAKLLQVSSRTLWAMQKEGRMPAPIRIGRAVRWSYESLKKWVEAGCPDPAA